MKFVVFCRIVVIFVSGIWWIGVVLFIGVLVLVLVIGILGGFSIFGVVIYFLIGI